MKRSLLSCIILICFQVSAFATIDTTPYFEPLFVDGNAWTYQTQNGETYLMEVLPGTVSFNGCPDAKKVRILRWDASANPWGEYHIRYYKQDAAGFYEIGGQKYSGQGDPDDSMLYELTYTPYKHIAATEMESGVPLTTTGAYLVNGYPFPYEYSTTILAFEEISVPYGTVQTMKFQAELTTDMSSATELFWAGSDIGIVVQEDIDDGLRMELTQFYNSTTYADAGADISVFGENTVMDGTASFSDNGAIVSYEWIISNRIDPASVFTASGESPLLTNLLPGVYDVRLTIHDVASASATDSIVLYVFPPVAGDRDADGDVDGADLAAGGDTETLAATFGSEGPQHDFIGIWYHYQGPYMGFAKTKRCCTLTSTGYEERLSAWYDDQWIEMAVFNGIAVIDGNTAWLTMTDVFYKPHPDTPGDWYPKGSEMFEMIAQGYWGSKTIQVMLEIDGSDMIYWMDQNGDSMIDPEEQTRLFPVEDDTMVDGSGTFPQLQYAGLNFHNDPETTSIYVSYDTSFLSGLHEQINSVVVDIQREGRSITGIDLQWYPDRDEWGQSGYPLSPAADDGIWWISRVETTMQDGSSSIYTAGSPYGTFSYSIITSTVFSKDSIMDDLIPGQDYAPPAAAAYFYITTSDEGAPASRQSDPVIKVFGESDTTQWIAINDDGNDGRMAQLKIPLVPGRYYVSVENVDYGSGIYAIRGGSDGYVNATVSDPGPTDPYEPDDTPDQATPLLDGIEQSHSIDFGDADWFAIDIH